MSAITPTSQVLQSTLYPISSELTLVDSKEELFELLYTNGITNSERIVLRSIDPVPLSPEAIDRLNALRHTQFTYYSNSKLFPKPLGTTSIDKQLSSIAAPAYLVGSYVWEILGKEFINDVFAQLGISLSERLLQEVIKSLHPTDVDVSFDCSVNSFIYDLIKERIITSMLPGKFEKKPTDFAFLQAFAFLKSKEILPGLKVDSIGHREGFRTEYVSSKNISESPPLCTLSGLKISFDDFGISFLEGTNPVQCLIDYISKWIRTDNNEMDERGCARIFSYLVLGFKIVDPQLLDRLSARLIQFYPQDETFAIQLISLFQFTVTNHLPKIPHALFELTFKISYLFAQKLPTNIFSGIWKMIKELYSDCQNEEIKQITETLSKSPSPVVFLHLLALDENPRCGDVVPPLSFEQLENYCKNPLPLIVEHARFGHFKRSAEEMLFSSILQSPAFFALWDQLATKLKADQKNVFLERCPTRYYKRGPSIVLSDLFKPTEPLSEAARAAAEGTDLVPSRVDEVITVELSDQEKWDAQFIELCEIGKKEPSKATTRIQQLLIQAEQDVWFLDSHDHLAELILMGLSLSKPIQKQNYGLNLNKIASAQKRLEIAFKLNALKYPYDQFNFVCTVSNIIFDTENDKKVRVLNKDPILSLPAVILINWLRQGLSQHAYERINSWLELFTQSGRLYLAQDNDTKGFINELFEIPQISFTLLDKLKSLYFTPGESWKFFYDQSLLRRDRGVVYFRWSQLTFCEDKEVMQLAQQNFKLEEAEKLVEESRDKETMPLLDQKFLPTQAYCDTLTRAIMLRVKKEALRYENVLKQLFLYVNFNAPSLECHNGLANLAISYLQTPKSLSDHRILVDFTKISSAEMKLELITLFDSSNISYPMLNISSWVSSMEWNAKNDQLLRQHIPDFPKAPFEKSVLVQWIEKVCQVGDEASKKGWLYTITTYLVNALMHEQVLITFGKSLPLLKVDPEQLLKLMLLQPPKSFEDNFMFLEPFVVSGYFLSDHFALSFVFSLLELGCSSDNHNESLKKKAEENIFPCIEITTQFFSNPHFYSKVNQAKSEKEYLDIALTCVAKEFLNTYFDKPNEEIAAFRSLVQLFSACATREWFDVKEHTFRLFHLFFKKYNGKELLDTLDHKKPEDTARAIALIKRLNVFYLVFVEELLSKRYPAKNERGVIETAFNTLYECIPYHEDVFYTFYQLFVQYGRKVDDSNNLCFITSVVELTACLVHYLTHETKNERPTCVTRGDLEIVSSPLTTAALIADLKNAKKAQKDLLIQFAEKCNVYESENTAQTRFHVFQNFAHEESALLMIDDYCVPFWNSFLNHCKDHLDEIWEGRNSCRDTLRNYFRNRKKLEYTSAYMQGKRSHLNYVALKFLAMDIDNLCPRTKFLGLRRNFECYIDNRMFEFHEREFLDLLNTCIEKYPYWYAHNPSVYPKNDHVLNILLKASNFILGSARMKLALLFVKWVKVIKQFSEKESLEKLIEVHGRENFRCEQLIRNTELHLEDLKHLLLQRESIFDEFPTLKDLLPFE